MFLFPCSVFRVPKLDLLIILDTLYEDLGTIQRIGLYLCIMPDSAFHIVQVNIAHALAPMDDPQMKGFVDRLVEINTLAEQSPGFVWRLQDDTGDATSILAFDDPTLLINMSAWSSIESLEAYVYNSAHTDVMRGRKQWFRKPTGPYQVLFWIPAGTIPTTEDAKRALDTLQDLGPTPAAFTFQKRFDPPV